VTIKQLHARLGKLIEKGKGSLKVVVDIDGWGSDFDDGIRTKVMTLHHDGDEYWGKPNSDSKPVTVLAIDTCWQSG
jgi:hypothetical protein